MKLAAPAKRRTMAVRMIPPETVQEKTGQEKTGQEKTGQEKTGQERAVDGPAAGSARPPQTGPDTGAIPAPAVRITDLAAWYGG